MAEEKQTTSQGQGFKHLFFDKQYPGWVYVVIVAGVALAVYLIVLLASG